MRYNFWLTVHDELGQIVFPYSLLLLGQGKLFRPTFYVLRLDNLRHFQRFFCFFELFDVASSSSLSDSCLAVAHVLATSVLGGSLFVRRGDQGFANTRGLTL